MIETFWNICLLHDITTRDQLLRKAVRVVRTKQSLAKHGEMADGIETRPEKLFQWMKEQVGNRELGHFPGDRDLFYRLYHVGKELDLLEYAIQTLQQDRTTGTLLVHPGLTERFMELCEKHGHRSLLIVEAEKYLPGLLDMIRSNRSHTFALLTENYTMGRLLNAYFGDYPNVQVFQGSIYQPLPLGQQYDAILSIPHFGMKVAEEDDVLIRESEGAAVNHLLPFLREGGSLSVTLPARMMFQPGEIGKWRKRTNEQVPVESIYMLPDGLFRPYASVKTYQVVFRKAHSDDIFIGKLQIEKSRFVVKREISLKRDTFNSLDDWRIDLLLDEDRDKLRIFHVQCIESEAPGCCGNLSRKIHPEAGFASRKH